MDLQLSGKVVMVAAASKGLGFGIARVLAREGAVLSIASRSSGEIERAAAQLREEQGGDVLARTFNATDSASITAWTEATVARFGGIDGLVTNAGGPPVGTFDTLDDAAWQSACELTLMSVVRLIRAVLPTMRARGGGSILALTSTSVKESIANLLLSNVFRSGVTSLAKSLSRELAPENIRVNTLMPGRIATDRMISLDTIAAERAGISVAEQARRSEMQIPLGRYGTPDEFGNAAAFLLSPAASYITGTSLAVDGGFLHTVW